VLAAIHLCMAQHQDIGWELYRSFLAVLSEGSLSGAARTLGVAQPTVGRHVEALEKSLNLALFTRSQIGLMPTEAALSLRIYAESMRSTVAALERAAANQGSGVRGTVRVTASDVIGVEVLPPIIARLRDQHPDLAVELVLTDVVQDLLRREADIAVRMVRPTGTAGRKAHRSDRVGTACASELRCAAWHTRQHSRSSKAFTHRL